MYRLRELGHAVSEASSGADALAKLPTFSVDIIVTDYKMPRMDGAEWASRVQELWPELPLLLNNRLHRSSRQST